MNNKVYMDTSVISALFDKRTPERMKMTENAWEQIKNYDVYISDIVVAELQMADAPLVEKFNKVVANFHILIATDEAQALAKTYIEQEVFPAKYFDDALHVAICSVNEIGLLLSWNFRHLVKVKTRKMVSAINIMKDYSPVEIIAPPEL